MNDILKTKLLEILDAIASESRWAGDYSASGDRRYERESRKEADRLTIEVVKFVDDHFVEKSWMDEYWK